MIDLSVMASYRIALALAIIGSLVLVWISLGVGIIGADGDPANRMYFGVVGIGAVGALLARFRPRGMAFTLFAMAAAQALIGAYAVVTGVGMPYSPPLEILGLTAFFVAAFAASGWLFRLADKR